MASILKVTDKRLKFWKPRPRGVDRPGLPTLPPTSDHPLKEPQALSSPLQGRPWAGLEVKSA